MTVAPDAPGRQVGGSTAAAVDRRGPGRAGGVASAVGSRPTSQAIEPRRGGDAVADAPAGDHGAEAAGAKKSGKKKLVLAAVVVLVLGAAGYVVKGRPHKVTYQPGQAVPLGKVVSLGTLTVNTSDGHLVQAGIDLQLTKPAQAKEEATDQPQLTNAAITDLGDWTYAQLLTPSGRIQLQQQLLSSFQKVLGTVDGAAQQVSAVYFTQFILQ